ncbi:MAG TPA: prepilin-type N-terminal cleavage/methylation domain-containing protein [Bryobacteraceae bacterium]|nr:prepilin-type N-terminal cleavage/methylation domain-containing protein [Bryobacteraceae bacterium]
MRRSEAGLTLIEILVAMSLLSMLSVGVLAAIRLGLDAVHNTDARLMENRRIAGAQRALENQLAGFMPLKAICPAGPNGPQAEFPFFEGQPQSMRLASTYSLQEAWRGRPYIDEFQVIAGANGVGVRLIVNEIPFTSPLMAGLSCEGMAPDPESGRSMPQFAPIQIGPQSFVLADKLAWCRFSYLEPGKPPEDDRWRANWVQPHWPAAVRVEMAPLDDNRVRLRPLTITSAIRVNSLPELRYVD